MADIELVIKLPEKMYHMMNAGFYDYGDMNVIIRNGTPLPKGHGRLIDADALIDSLDASDRDIYCKAVIEEDAPTIIEADKEYEAEVITRGKCMMCGKELTEGLFFCKECGDKANSGK